MRVFINTAAASVILAAAAPVAAQPRNLDLPGGSLGRAVIALGRQAKISISLADPSLSGVRVRRVRGHMTADQALARMLAGTPARFVVLGNSTYLVVRMKPRTVRRARTAPLPATAPAADPPPQDIVVTASKRRIPLRDYPGPVHIVGSGDLPLSFAGAGIDALTNQIAVLGSTHLGPGRDKIFIRAIADSSFSGQTQATVGQYLGEARLNYNSPDPNLRLYDIGSVELLPGPQGTLYGAGTIGGVLRSVPNSPELKLSSARLRMSGALTAHGAPSRELAAILNLPLTDGGAAVRLVGYSLSEGGYIDDLGRHLKDVNRTDIAGARARLRVEVAQNIEVEATGVAQRISARDSQYAVKDEGPLERRTALAQPFRNDFALGNVVVRADWGTYRLLASATVAEQGLAENFDASIFAGQLHIFRQRNRAQLASGELRLSGGGGSGAGWLAGMSLVHNQRRLDRAQGPPRQLLDQPSLRNTIDEQTLFGEVTYPIQARLNLTAGARVTHVNTQGRLDWDDQPVPKGTLQSKAREWQVLPSLALGADLGAQAIAYARYQEGFRPSGVILVAGAAQRLESDHVAAWEAGVRFRSIGTVPLSGSLSAAYTKWTDVQADLIDNTGFPSTTNLGNGNVWTLDGQLEARLGPGLTAKAAAVVNRSRVTNPNPGIIQIDGDPLPNVPDFSGRIAIDYVRPLSARADLRVLGWARYVGRSRLGIGPNLGRDQGNYLDSGVEAQLGLGKVMAFLSVTNLFDSTGNRFALGSIPSFGSEEQTTPLRPRTLRVGVDVGF